MDTNITLAEITANNYQTAVIFKKYGIDFCCGGKKTLQEACLENNIDESIIIGELESSNINSISQENYSEWNIDFLADYIVSTQHQYVRKNLPIIKDFLEKTVDKHSSNHPELIIVQKNYNQAYNELIPHMQKEEQILFPYIKQMIKMKELNRKMNESRFGTVRNPISMMEQEHEMAGALFKNIREISKNLTPPEDACKTYQVTYSMINEFEENLHFHIHLENNILFPKAIKLEEEILN